MKAVSVSVAEDRGGCGCAGLVDCVVMVIERSMHARLSQEMVSCAHILSCSGTPHKWVEI